MREPEKLLEPVAVITDALCWITILGCIQLALRQPEYTGPSSLIARRFASQLASQLADKVLEEGVLSPEELATIMLEQMRAEARKPS